MNFESLGTGITDKKNKEIRSQVKKATDEADPTAYSLHHPEKMRTKIIRPFDEYDLSVRTGGGETYYELSDLHDPRGQQVVARMLKGILNVSDVVVVPDRHGDEKYYSWKTPLDKIEKKSTKEQVIAEQLLLRYLFNSRDHLFNRYTNGANNGRYKDEKLVHFDFGEDAYRFLEMPFDRNSVLADFRSLEPETISALRNKVAELQARFEGESGKAFFRSIIEASDAPATELFGPSEVFEKYPDIEPLDLLHRVLVGRIVGLKNALDQIDRPE